MTLFINIIHIFSCIVLIMIVLLQTGKGTDMGSAFGGGTSQTLFGSTGASTFLSKVTTIMAIIFMLTCFTLAYISTNSSTNSNSIMKNKASDTQTTIPVSNTVKEKIPLNESHDTVKDMPLNKVSDDDIVNDTSLNSKQHTPEVNKTEVENAVVGQPIVKKNL